LVALASPPLARGWGADVTRGDAWRLGLVLSEACGVLRGESRLRSFALHAPAPRTGALFALHLPCHLPPSPLRLLPGHLRPPERIAHVPSLFRPAPPAPLCCCSPGSRLGLQVHFDSHSSQRSIFFGAESPSVRQLTSELSELISGLRVQLLASGSV